MKILSIDDSKAVHAFLKMCFEGGSYELDFARDAEAGLKKISSNQYDMILLDWEMPGKTGPEALAEIRESGNKTPIIMLTSKNNTADIVRVLELGANEYVMKPFTVDIILEKIKTVLVGG